MEPKQAFETIKQILLTQLPFNGSLQQIEQQKNQLLEIIKTVEDSLNGNNGVD